MSLPLKNSYQGEQAPQIAEPLEVVASLCSLRKATEEMYSRLLSLSERLMPVRRQHPSELANKQETPRPALVPIAEELRQIEDRIGAASRVMNEIVSSIQI